MMLDNCKKYNNRRMNHLIPTLKILCSFHSQSSRSARSSKQNVFLDSFAMGLRIILFLMVANLGIQSASAFRKSPEKSFVKVAVTAQDYDFIHPWEKKRPITRRGIGAVLSYDMILVTANLVANASFIELEMIDHGEKCPASVVEVDYSANLAILSPKENTFLISQQTIKIYNRPVKVGDNLDIWQFEENGTSLIANGELKGIEVNRYPFDDSAKLVFQVKALLSEVGSSYTLPVLKQGKLVGLMMKYNRGAQRVIVVPHPVINHFLTDFLDGNYEGFPQAAFSLSSLKDPQQKRFFGVSEADVGVYIENVRPGGPAHQAGLKVEDVLLAIDEFAVDTSGQYEDPDYGKLSIAHLTTTRSFSRDIRIFKVLRNRKKESISIKLEPLRNNYYPIPPYIVDQAPKYIVIGGLVFQELSTQYLKEWGSSWRTTCPQNLLHYQRKQWDLLTPGNKVVFLSQVLPSQLNNGYGDLRYLVVSEMNRIKVLSIEDLVMAIENPVDGFHEVKFEKAPNTIYLDSSTTDRENKKIKKRYNLPSLARLENPSLIPTTPTQ